MNFKPELGGVSGPGGSVRSRTGMGGFRGTNIKSLFDKGLPRNKTKNDTATAQKGHRADTRDSQAGCVRQPELR